MTRRVTAGLVILFLPLAEMPGLLEKFFLVGQYTVGSQPPAKIDQPIYGSEVPAAISADALLR